MLGTGFGRFAHVHPPIGSAWAQDNPTVDGAPVQLALDGPTDTNPQATDGASDSSWDRRDTFWASLTIFVLAVFLGTELISKVPPVLHTPLMSGSNAISGIILVGAIVVTGTAMESWMATSWGTLAIVLATINAVGGFAVTHRMLAMFRRK